MNLIEAFVGYLEDLGIGTSGSDIFIGQAPSSDKVPDDIWWVVASGGSPASVMQTGESIKTYQIDIFRRARDYQTVYDDLHDLEQQLNCSECVEIEGFDTISAQAQTFPIDNDLDQEDRKVGLLQATLTIHKECN